MKGGDIMEKKWYKPEIEVLTIRKTMAGPGLIIPDKENDDPDEVEADHYS